MRRTQRVEHANPESGIRRGHTREKRPSLTPRARRQKLDLALRYRLNSTGIWYEGRIENLSQTGVLFRGTQALPAGAVIEMIFDMPEEISGQKNRSVVCQGRIIRSQQPLIKDENHAKDEPSETPRPEAPESLSAASIVDYKFIRQN
jgi:hypothetical protein